MTIIKNTTVLADYRIRSEFSVEGDITTAFDWYIKYDRLHIIWKKGDQEVVLEPLFTASQSDFKYPYESFVDKEWLRRIIQTTLLCDDLFDMNDEV